jgi:cyclase
MKNRLILAAVLATAMGGAYVRAQFGQAPAKLDVVKVREDVFVIHNDYVPGNTTALVTNEGVILVDDKFEIDHANILAQLKTFTNQPVKYVINTHHHGDHSGSNAKMQTMGVQVVSSQQARENMVDGNQPGLSNITFDGKASLYLGGKKVELYHFGRAHTNGDAVVLFPAQRVLAAGDMYTVGDSTPQLVDYAGGGSAKEWTSTVDKGLQLNFDTVVPGHGPVSNKAELQKFRESTARLRSRVHEMIVQKKSKDEISKMLASEFHFAEFHLNASLDGLLVELR